MPDLSVIIPSFNRAARLRACLEALARQSQPPQDFEVIVVVDGSTDETMAMLAEFDAPFVLRPIWQQNALSVRALRKAATGSSSAHA